MSQVRAEVEPETVEVVDDVIADTAFKDFAVHTAELTEGEPRLFFM